MKKEKPILIKQDSVDRWVAESIVGARDGKREYKEYLAPSFGLYELPKVHKGRYKAGQIIIIELDCEVGIYRRKHINRLTYKVQEYDSLCDELKLIINEAIKVKCPYGNP